MIGLALLAALSTQPVLAAQPTPRVDKPAKALAIQNLMGRRLFCHSVCRKELERVRWSQRRAGEGRAR